MCLNGCGGGGGVVCLNGCGGGGVVCLNGYGGGGGVCVLMAVVVVVCVS